MQKVLTDSENNLSLLSRTIAIHLLKTKTVNQRFSFRETDVLI